MKAAKLIIFASPLPTHQWCVSAWLLIEDQIGLSQCGLVLCKFNCTTPLPAPELLTCRASQSQCGMATGPAGLTGLEGQTPLSQGRTSAPLPGTSLPGTSLGLGSLQTRSTPPFPPLSPVDPVINWICCVYEREKLPKIGEGIKRKKFRRVSSNSVLLNNQWSTV